MSERAALAVFGGTWSLLILLAVVAQAMSFADRAKRQAGLLTNLLVIASFVLVLGLFYLGRWFGTYAGSSAGRLAGAVLAVVGLGLYIAAHLYLRRNWSIAAVIIEGQSLVTAGPYRYVRHPMYTGMMVVVVGSGLLVSNYAILASIVPVAAAYYIRARREESLLMAEFPEYREYAARTKMFIPGVF
jgi:protein-S-isoprenylcysteine O-methyltransferase Ste14